MTSVAATTRVPHAHHDDRSFLRKYIFSTDHKIIGIQFLFVSLFFLLLGGVLAMQMRWQLGFPGKPMPGAGLLPESMAAGGVTLPEYYVQLVSMHGTFMVFFAIMPLLVGVYANFLIPLKIGTHDMASPRINMASFWAALVAGLLMFASLFVPEGGIRSGWTNYAPLSARPDLSGVTIGQLLWCVSIVILGLSSVMGSVNYITTIINHRAPGMTWFRMPLSVWALFITAILAVLALPVLQGAAILLLFDQTIGTHFFDPAAGRQGLLWQHPFSGFGPPPGLMAATPVDMFIHDTYFIVAHLHYVLFGGSLFALFAAIPYWFPKMFGRMMSERWGKVHFWLTFVFYNLTFFPMHILGNAGHMRRIYDPTQYDFLKPYQPMNEFISIAAFLLFATQLIFFVNFWYSLFKGEKAPQNPWEDNGLEWSLPSPAPHGNWERVPTVYRGPYEFSSPQVPEDYLPQTRKLPGDREPAAASAAH